jgi:transcriptional antiterminator RfaH
MDKSLSLSTIPESVADGCSWYCVRTQPKHEHIAAARLRLLENVDVFCPRIRIRRLTRKGPAWFSEALFPGYLFAKFDRVENEKMVTYAQGVTGLVRFGLEPVVVPNAVVSELREWVGDEIFTINPSEIESGDSVVVTGGAFQGIKTLVSQVLPGTERVRILIELLGAYREVEIRKGDLFKESAPLLTRGPLTA